MDDSDSSPVAVVDDFISNEDIAYALHHLNLEDDHDLPEINDVVVSSEEDDQYLLRVFDDDEEGIFKQETNPDSSLEPEFEQLAAEFDSLALDDPFMLDNDAYEALYYCQPCNDPNSIPPLPIMTEDAISVAAALLAAEYQNAAERENESFWREQLRVLGGPEDFSPEDEDIPDDWVPDPIPLLEQESERKEEEHPVLRSAAITAAQPFLEAFSATLWNEEQENTSISTLRECLGHKERILGCAISPDGNYLATASQDATVRIWDIKTQKQLKALNGTSEEELLRVAWYENEYLAIGGADGWVHLYHVDDWSLVASIDHGTYLKAAKPKTNNLESIQEEAEETNEEDTKDSGTGPPQIYSLQFVNEWKALPSTNKNDEDVVETVFLLTSADDFLILWELDLTHKKTKTVDGSASRQIETREIFSLHFSPISALGYGVSVCNISRGNVTHANAPSSDAFGGVRNPDNLIYVFDASYCSTNGLIGAALSDGTLRLMNGRGVCLSALSLPGCQSHLTSFTWDSTGRKLATTVATGHVIVWYVELLENETIQRSCEAVFQGGHIPGRPVFGARYMQNDELLITWGSDGRLCLWDGKATVEVDAPLSLLLEKESYPIYGVDISADNGSKVTVAAAGGGAIGGFLGIPVYLQDVVGLAEEAAESSASKRTKVSS